MKDRLQKELMRREGLESSDAHFKAMAAMDGVDNAQSGFDIDAKGQFMRGADGYNLGEVLDYHDMEGRELEKGQTLNRIIGKTSPKTEILTEGHPGNQVELTVMQKVEKQLAAMTRIMNLDSHERKHWYYRLKREYTEEAKVRKRLE